MGTQFCAVGKLETIIAVYEAHRHSGKISILRIIKIIYTTNITTISIFLFVVLVHNSFEIIFLLCCDNKNFWKLLIKLGMKILRINMVVKYSIKYCILIVHIITSDEKKK